MARPDKTDKVRRWDGTTSAINELGQPTVWVVWGVTDTPAHSAGDGEHFTPDELGDGMAAMRASLEDEEFAYADDDLRWATIVEGNKADVAEWVYKHEEARGFASYVREARLLAAATWGGDAVDAVGEWQPGASRFC